MSQELLSRVEQVVAEGKAIVIKDAETAEAANGVLTKVKGLMKEVDNTFDPIEEKQKEALTETKKQHAKHKDPLKLIWDAVKAGLNVFMLAEQKKAEAAAQELRKSQEAAALEEAGGAKDPEAGDRILDKALSAPPVAPAAPKLGGYTVREEPDFEILDAAKIPAKYTKPDEVEIRKTVKALGKEAEKIIPGIRVFMKAVGTKR